MGPLLNSPNGHWGPSPLAVGSLKDSQICANLETIQLIDPWLLLALSHGVSLYTYACSVEIPGYLNVDSEVFSLCLTANLSRTLSCNLQPLKYPELQFLFPQFSETYMFPTPSPKPHTCSVVRSLPLIGKLGNHWGNLICFPSFRDHNSAFLIIQCLKAVS